MGQTSLPYLNRAGVFAFWNNMWDSKYQYQRYLIRFSYLEQFFLNFFKNQIFLYRFLNIKKGLKVSHYFFQNFEYKLVNTNFYKTITKFKFCTSKLWVLKYNNWVILSIYLLDIGAKYWKKKRKNKRTANLLFSKVKKDYNILNLRNLHNKGRKSKKFLLKKTVRKLKKFFKNQQSTRVNTAFFWKKIKFFERFSTKKKKSRRKVFKKDIFKKTQLTAKVLNFFKKKVKTASIEKNVALSPQQHTYAYF